ERTRHGSPRPPPRAAGPRRGDRHGAGHRAVRPVDRPRRGLAGPSVLVHPRGRRGL
ncbi:MAG: hypothetical protein AVDCRST_MAG66-2341, partial [uncultured Pseudonocardia sp.]